MILKRLASSLKKQDWTAILIELVVVVVGILIAIQLDNWNSERLARAQAVAWRSAIVDDLEATRRQVTHRVTYYRGALDFARTALSGMQDREQVDAQRAWPIVLGAFQAGQIWPLKIEGPTYRAVQAAGKLHLIGDEAVLRGLTDYYDITADDFAMLAGFRPPYRERIRECLPWPIQEYLWQSDCQRATRDEQNGGFVFVLQDCVMPELPEVLIETVARLRQDEDLQDKLRGRMSQLKILIETLGRHLSHIDGVVATIDA